MEDVATLRDGCYRGHRDRARESRRAVLHAPRCSSTHIAGRRDCTAWCRAVELTAHEGPKPHFPCCGVCLAAASVAQIGYDWLFPLAFPFERSSPLLYYQQFSLETSLFQNYCTRQIIVPGCVSDPVSLFNKMLSSAVHLHSAGRTQTCARRRPACQRTRSRLHVQ